MLIIVGWPVKEYTYKGRLSESRILTHIDSDILSNHGSTVAFKWLRIPINTPSPQRPINFVIRQQISDEEM